MKKVLAILLAVMMVLSCAACSMSAPTSSAPAANSGSASSGIKIGASMYDLSDPYFVEIANGIKDKAAELGVEVVMDDPAGDTNKQVASVENFTVSGCNGIILAAVEPESVNNLLKQAQDKGIKVLAQNHPVEYFDSFITIIEYDYGYAGGVMCGEWINETYPNEAEVQVGVIGAGLHTTGVDRTKGICDGIAATAKNAVVVTEQDGEGLTEKAMSVAENMLQAYPDLKAICCFDDLAGLGALEAVKANKSEEEQKGFGVFGLDCVEQAVAEIAKGGAYKGTVDIAPYETGKKAVELTVKLINGESVEKQYVQDMVPVTSKNVADYQ